MKPMNQKQGQQAAKFSLAAFFVVAAHNALAAGGLSSVEGGIKEFITGFYGIVGIIAGVALLCTFLWGKLGKKHWSDVVETCAWIVGAAASLAIAKALWDWGKSASF